MTYTNPDYAKKSPKFKKNFRNMVDQHNANKANKDKNKNKKSKLEQFAERLYGGNK